MTTQAGVNKWLKKFSGANSKIRPRIKPSPLKKSASRKKASPIGAYPDMSDSGLCAVMADWCGHCSRFKPLWNRVEKGDPSYFFSVQQTQDGNELQEFKRFFAAVKGYPTVVRFNGQKVYQNVSDFSRRIRTQLETLAQNESNDTKLAEHLKKFAKDLLIVNQNVSDLINLTIGMNLDNNGNAVDAYGSESCGEGYGY